MDTGAGIAQEDFPKLFTRFGKLQRTAKLNHEGIGLGLTIVKRIVEQSGGEISVVSDGPGHGSCFCFSMLMEQAESISIPSRRSAESIVPRRRPAESVVPHRRSAQ